MNNLSLFPLYTNNGYLLYSKLIKTTACSIIIYFETFNDMDKPIPYKSVFKTTNVSYILVDIKVNHPPNKDKASR